MSDDSAQGKARRWRWITLAELLAVATVLISAFALYDSHSARTEADAERLAVQSKASVRSDRLLLVGTARDDGRSLRLAPASASQVIQSQLVRFPSALGV